MDPINHEDSLSLAGKTALVTGGTGGLGAAIAKKFIEQGADVAVCSLHPEKAGPLRELGLSLGRRVLPIGCDIKRPHQVEEMMEQIKDGLGGLDILVNSAGMNRLIRAEEYPDEDFSQVMALNLNALHTVTREAGRRFMIPKRYGRILNLSSVKSFIGTTENYIAYCASKGAVNMYTKQLACEWGKYGITCNALAPTFVRTPINSFQLDDPAFYESLTRRIPLGRIGKEEDVAGAALFLCSDMASFITGQVLGVDGGLTAMQ